MFKNACLKPSHGTIFISHFFLQNFYIFVILSKKTFKNQNKYYSYVEFTPNVKHYISRSSLLAMRFLPHAKFSAQIEHFELANASHILHYSPSANSSLFVDLH